MRSFPWKWYLKDLPKPDKGKVFSTFACGGGSSMGYKRAGFEMVGCCEIDPEINAIYKQNLHPKHNFLMDLRKFNELTELPQDLYELDILDGSPPCFEAGTLVRVRNGYKAIEDVRIGDEVMTHNGRYRKVYSVMSKLAEGHCVVKVQGMEAFKATPNHPFYVREMRRVGDRRMFGEPCWKAIGDVTLCKNTSGTTKSQFYAGIPLNREEALPAWEGVEYHHHIYGKKTVIERKCALNMKREAFWKLVGRYIGDGWTRLDRKEVIICCAKDERAELERIVREAKMKATWNEERTTYRATIHSVELFAYLLQFGHGATGKHLTDDVFNLPARQLNAFMEGYLGADGHYDKSDRTWHCSSVSRELIVGLAACIAKVYHQPVTMTTKNNVGRIEGRCVNCHKAWALAFRKERRDQQHFVCEDGFLWVPIRSVVKKEDPLFVFNMSVEEDESYTVYNMAVHNCSTFSTAGKREKGWGVEKVFREGQAKQTLDDLFFVYLETVKKLKPKVCVAENVTGLVKGNAKGYVNQIAAGFRELGYEVQLFLLNGAYMEVPQKRERVFFVANRMGYPKLKLAFNYKPVTFGEVKTKEGARIKGDVSDVAGTARLLAKARPGDTSLSDINARERGKSNIGFTMNLVWDNMVPATVSSGGGVFRMPEGTEASKGDFAAMGTFPQDYWFGDDETAARRMAHYMVGMSVPPSMTAHIADEIWEQWLKPGVNK